ncbi:hypothetical protein F4802DRAFT_595260 [Xylaria palmicola]|nr:hypothetical protein F4802DRAFT_595260 [Xylaria palmicola]
MNNLPYEIHDLIIQFVDRRLRLPWQHSAPPPALPAIAAVSRNFQRAVERLTFRNLKVSTAPSDLDDFRRALTPQRQHNLRRLIVSPRVDYASLRAIPGTGQRRRFATAKERRAINETTTAQLREFFNILATWPSSEPSLTLVFASSLGDPYIKYFRFSLLDVSSDLTDFPPLPMVKRLHVVSTSCHLHPHLAVALTAKMPNVSHVEWHFLTRQRDADWGLYHYVSRLWRDGLVQSIESITLPSSVESFRFEMSVPGVDRFQILPKFIGSTSSPGPVSYALRKLTKDCTEIVIEGPIHPSLFDPLAVPSTSSHEATVTWEKVTQLAVCARRDGGANGGWLFKLDPEDAVALESPPEHLDLDHLPPGYGTTESELDEAEKYYDDHLYAMTPFVREWKYKDIWDLRMEVDDGPMNTLLAAFARGCRNMPALRTAAFETELYSPGSWWFQVTCFAAGEATPWGWDAEFADGDCSTWRVFFHVYDWRPAEETLEAFRRIGREHDGRDTVVCFLPLGEFHSMIV